MKIFQIQEIKMYKLSIFINKN